MYFWIYIIIAVVILFLGRLHFSGRECKIVKDISHQVIIITGASAGIGEYSALALAKMGATLVLACRSEKKTLPVIEKLKRESKNEKIFFMHLDCAQLKSIKSFAEEFKKVYGRLDVLIHNAGVTLDKRIETEDGFESTFQVNYLAPFYLTHLLIDSLKKTQPSRVVVIASKAQERGKVPWDDLQSSKNFFGFTAYSDSKLEVVMFTKELSDRLEKTDVKAVSVHPGTVRTEIFSKFLENSKCMQIIWCLVYPFFWYISKNSQQGAQTTLECSLINHEDLRNGEYYDNCRIGKMNSLVRKEENLRLWNVTLDLLRNSGHSVDHVAL